MNEVRVFSFLPTRLMKMKMKMMVKGVALLSTIYMTANPALSQNTAACELPPNLVSPLETGPFTVSTYHTTGVPGSDRVIQVQWPKDIKVPISGVPPDRTDGAESVMGFHIPDGEFSILNSRGKREGVSFPKFYFSVNSGVDRYPLYSRLRLIGGSSNPNIYELLDSGSGYTYRSSEGFDTFPDEDHGSWIRFAYPNARGTAYNKDTFFRGTPEIDGVEAILSCSRWIDGPIKYSQCQILKKREPFFYEATVQGRDIDDLPVIEYVMDRLMECIIGEI